MSLLSVPEGRSRGAFGLPARKLKRGERGERGSVPASRSAMPRSLNVHGPADETANLATRKRASFGNCVRPCGRKLKNLQQPLPAPSKRQRLPDLAHASYSLRKATTPKNPVPLEPHNFLLSLKWLSVGVVVK